MQRLLFPYREEPKSALRTRAEDCNRNCNTCDEKKFSVTTTKHQNGQATTIETIQTKNAWAPTKNDFQGLNDFSRPIGLNKTFFRGRCIAGPDFCFALITLSLIFLPTILYDVISAPVRWSQIQ